MGARDALKPLLHVLGERQSQRVIVAAADAMSRLGSFEAALEILPRMHTTESPVLQRQFAIAMGNLLGTPGELYPIVTGSGESRSVAMEKLQAEVQKTLQGIIASAGPRCTAAIRESLVSGVRRLRDAANAADYAAIIEELYTVVLNLCRMLSGRDATEEEALGFAFMHNARLGLGLWFASEVRSRLAALQGTPLLEIDALLGMYFLSEYSDIQEDET
jgi:hypothetical protein